MTSPVIVDIEYFGNLKNGIIVKQIAVSGDFVDSVILKSPYSIRKLKYTSYKNVKWLSNYWHGFSWSEGDYPYEFLYHFVEAMKLRYPNRAFYSKGLEKTTFLGELFNLDFVNLDSIECPKMIGQSFCSCKRSGSVHSMKNHCAKRKVVFYHAWLRTHLHEQSVTATVRRLGNLPACREFIFDQERNSSGQLSEHSAESYTESDSSRVLFPETESSYY
jgi:hypothetical protein